MLLLKFFNLGFGLIGLQQYFENRLKSLAAEKANGENPYPHKFQGANHLSVPEYVKKYGILESGVHSEDEVSLTGKFSAF